MCIFYLLEILVIISFFKLDNSDYIIFSDVLKRNKSVRTFYVSGKKIESSGIESFGSMLIENRFINEVIVLNIDSDVNRR